MSVRKWKTENFTPIGRNAIQCNLRKRAVSLKEKKRIYKELSSDSVIPHLHTSLKELK